MLSPPPSTHDPVAELEAKLAATEEKLTDERRRTAAAEAQLYEEQLAHDETKCALARMKGKLMLAKFRCHHLLKRKRLYKAELLKDGGEARQPEGISDDGSSSSGGSGFSSSGGRATVGEESPFSQNE